MQQERRQRLSGDFDHSLDDKGRLTLPRKYRERFEEAVYLVRLTEEEPSVRVYDEEGWAEFDQRYLDPLDEFGSEEDSWRIRGVYRNLYEVKPDKAGRILLPSRFVEELGLNRKVKIIGNRTHLEVWNPDTLSRLETQRSGRAE
jgi:MraZ protein